MPGLPIGPLELIIILVIALLVLGPGRLPEVGSAFGKTIREFRKASTDIQDAATLDRPVDQQPAAGLTATRSADTTAVVTDAAPAEARAEASAERP